MGRHSLLDHSRFFEALSAKGERHHETDDIPARAAPSIANADFEAVQIGSPFLSSNPADVPGWTHTGTVGDALLWAVGYADSGGSVTVAGHGNQFVTLGSGCCGAPVGSSAWQSTITGLTPGQTYKLTFALANETDSSFAYNQTMSVGFSTARQPDRVPIRPRSARPTTGGLGYRKPRPS